MCARSRARRPARVSAPSCCAGAETFLAVRRLRCAPTGPGAELFRVLLLCTSEDDSVHTEGAPGFKPFLKPLAPRTSAPLAPSLSLCREPVASPRSSSAVVRGSDFRKGPHPDHGPPGPDSLPVGLSFQPAPPLGWPWSPDLAFTAACLLWSPVLREKAPRISRCSQGCRAGQGPGPPETHTPPITVTMARPEPVGVGPPQDTPPPRIVQ